MNRQIINKILSNLGIYSRSKASNIIPDRKNFFIGSIDQIVMKVHLDCDIIHIKGKEIKSLKITLEFIIFYKPKNVITIISDNNNMKNIVDLFLEK